MFGKHLAPRRKAIKITNGSTTIIHGCYKLVALIPAISCCVRACKRASVLFCVSINRKFCDMTCIWNIWWLMYGLCCLVRQVTVIVIAATTTSAATANLPAKKEFFCVRWNWWWWCQWKIKQESRPDFKSRTEKFGFQSIQSPDDTTLLNFRCRWWVWAVDGTGSLKGAREGGRVRPKRSYYRELN